ncbi:MAG: FAD-dependent oxidoreductase, partial [Magnetococcales bacterium]|nr:FAD-dependent oxidoreductase [Magnetococcales bacterium]
PSLPIEQEETEEEGVEFRFLTAPVKVLTNDEGRAVGMRVITMELGEPDDSGRRRPVPIEGSEEDLDFDLIIPAIGQDPDLTCIENEPVKPDTTRWRTFIYDAKTCVTSIDGLFAAGDCAYGPDILIQCVGEGRKAALAINQYLNGVEISLKEEYAISRGRLADLEMADYSPRFVHQKRALEKTHPPQQRLTSGGGWDAINVGLTADEAVSEAGRCIECGCNARFDCDLRDYSTMYGSSEKLYSGEKRNYEEDKRHPLIKIESDKCITCASCVRICGEVRNIHALAFINRGFTTKIGPNFNDALQNTGCDACGMCIDVCPTGTLSTNTGKECGPWLNETAITSCTACSKGCGLKVYTKQGRVVKVRSIDGDPINGASICAEGRFSYKLTEGGDGVDSSVWERSINSARELMFKAEKVAVVVSTNLTVEETYAASQLATNGGGALYYVPGDSIEGEKAPLSKIQGEGNLALINRLGAKPWGIGVSADLVVLVDARVDPEHRQLGDTSVIAIGPFQTLDSVAVNITTSDPLNTEGAFLNREGSLAILRPALGRDDAHTIQSALAALANTNSLADLTSVRTKLAESVSELAPLTKLNGERLVTTALKPEPAAVASGSKETAFSNHMESIGLPW